MSLAALNATFANGWLIAPQGQLPLGVEKVHMPWLFAPVEIGGREYVDGGVWSPTNLDTAPVGQGAHVVCLNPTASLTATSDVISVFRRVSRSAAAIETLALRRRGATVRTFAPSLAGAEEMGLNLMDRRRAARVLAAGYRQGLEIAAGDGY